MFLHYEVVRGTDAVQPRTLSAQTDRIIPTSGPLQDGPSTGAAPKDRDAIVLAKRDIDLGGSAVGITQNDEVIFRQPEPKQFFLHPILTGIELDFVVSEVMSRRGKC